MIRSLITTLISIGYCYSQSIFSFKVVDQKTNFYIPFCYAIIKGSNTTKQANETGEIVITAKDNDTLVIYQLGYHLLKTTPDKIKIDKYTVSLKPKNILLDEVEVTAKILDTFMYKGDMVFLDFHFYDDHILALVNKGGKRNFLMMLDQYGNKLTERKLSINGSSIFKDCFGNLHLIGKDSVYQIYYNYQDLTLLPPYDIKKFRGFLEPCQCSQGDNMILKYKQYRGLKNYYYMFNARRPGQKLEMAIVADSVAIKGFNMDYDINYFLALRRKGAGYATSVSELTKHLDELREELILPPKYLLKPMESQMTKMDTSYVLLDHTNKFVHSFTLDGVFRTKTPFNEMMKNVSPHVFTDQDAHTYIFSSIDKKGVLKLYRYDPVKNVFTHKFELDKFYFVTNFKPKGNNLFFIYKDRRLASTKTKILKQFIVWQKL